MELRTEGYDTTGESSSIRIGSGRKIIFLVIDHKIVLVICPLSVFLCTLPFLLSPLVVR